MGCCFFSFQFFQKTVAEQKLDDTRHQLLAARTSQAEAVSLLETQITKLNSQITDSQTLLHEKEEFIKGLRESSLSQVKVKPVNWHSSLTVSAFVE